MRCWLLLSLVLSLLLASSLTVSAEQVAFTTEGINSDHYDCSMTITPAASLSPQSRLSLHCGTLRLVLTKSTLVLSSSTEGQATRLSDVASAVQPGTPYLLTLLRRGPWVGVLHGEALLCRGRVAEAAGPLGEARLTAEQGWSISHTQLVSREPIAFSDNFMRTADVPGEWKLCRGQWMLQSVWDNDARQSRHRFDLAAFAQNPFAWVGRAPGGSALCTVGKSEWDDYTFTAAAQPARRARWACW